MTTKNTWRYGVTVGMPGYMPNSVDGPYTGNTRRELMALIRDTLAQYDFPASLIRDANIRRNWPTIERYGSSSAHIHLYHGNEVISFNGLTEAECDEWEAQNDNA